MLPLFYPAPLKHPYLIHFEKAHLRKFDPEVVVQRGGHFRMLVGGVAGGDDAEDGALERVRGGANGTTVVDPNDVLSVGREAAVARRAHLRQQLRDLGQARAGLAGRRDGRLQVSAAQAVEDHRPHGNAVNQAVFKSCRKKLMKCGQSILKT